MSAFRGKADMTLCGNSLSRSLVGVKRTSLFALHMSASLIGRFGSCAVRLSTGAVSMSPAGSRFSSDSALWPFHHGVGERGGTIFWSALPSADGRSKQTYELTSSIVPRGTSFHRTVEFVFPPIGFDLAWSYCRLLPGPAEFGAVNPHAVHDHSQAARQCDDRLLPPAAPGDLHRPGLEPGPFCCAHQHDLRRLVEHRSHPVVAAL